MPDFTTEELPLSVTEDLVPSTAPKPACTTSIDFDGLLGTPLLLQDDPTECGGQLWPGGMVLAKYLLRCKTAELEGKTILALSLHPLRPSQIHLTDLPTIVPLLTLNIALNSPPTPTTAHVLNWGAPIPNTIPSPPDILLAADCVYFEPAFPLLLQTMRELIGPDTICYLCFKKRRRADMGFVKMARKVFEVRAVEDDPDGEVWGREGVHLYEIRCKQKASPG
ncbi:MAG: hypothetical protein LQ338_003462 [Usnochroma carphineum]|nr:MAG: hypothetical protein LQ338_003462 [Usnochroma carphineum]